MSQPASSQHSLKDDGDASSTIPKATLSEGFLADAVDAERAVACLNNSRVQWSQHAGQAAAGKGDAKAEGVAAEHKATDQISAEQAQHYCQTQQAAEHQPWEEAVQLLHSLARQISEREGTPAQHSPLSVPYDSSQQTPHASQPGGSAQRSHSMSQQPALCAKGQQSQPEPNLEQPNSATGEGRHQQGHYGFGAGEECGGDTRQGSLGTERRSKGASLQSSVRGDASQGQCSDSQPGTLSTALASLSRSTSCPRGAQQQCPTAAPLSTAHTETSSPGLTQLLSQGVPSTLRPSHALASQLTPESEGGGFQQNAGPSMGSQHSADKSDVQTTHGTSIDVGGPDDLPGARLRRPSLSGESPDGPILDSSAAMTISQGQPGAMQAPEQGQAGAQQKSGSTSAQDAGQGRGGMQATQVEDEGPGAEQTELTLCLQLSSEDQDLACGQQPSASLQPTGALGP